MVSLTMPQQPKIIFAGFEVAAASDISFQTFFPNFPLGYDSEKEIKANLRDGTYSESILKAWQFLEAYRIGGWQWHLQV